LSAKNSISFILGEETIHLSFTKEAPFSPTTTLLNYLRQLPSRKGTKEGCAEGDCGACTVVLGELTNDKKIKYTAVDSCLVFLPMLNGKWVITVEDLKDDSNNAIENIISDTIELSENENLSTLHPVQKSMVENHGAQCGFCTPGIVMSLVGLYKNKPNPAKNVIEDALTGNLCRCTGYRPIITAAFQSCSLYAKDKFDSLEKKIIPELISLNKSRKPLYFPNSDTPYHKVFHLDDALKLRAKFPKAILLSGATDLALKVTKKFENLPEIIDISEVKELKHIKKYNNRIEIGAAVTLSALKDFIENNPKRNNRKIRKHPKYDGEEWKNTFLALHNQLCVFGSLQIRNLATLGGNIGTASPISDLISVLMAYNAEIILQNKNKIRTLKLEHFVVGYRKTAIKPGELISKIVIPIPSSNLSLYAIKISNRKHLDIATVNAGFRLLLNDKKVIEEIALFYGGMSAWTKRAVKTENFLKGKIWSKETIEKAMDFLPEDFTPISDARSSTEFRTMVAKNLLLKFYYTNNTLSPCITKVP